VRDRITSLDVVIETLDDFRLLRDEPGNAMGELELGESAEFVVENGVFTLLGQGEGRQPKPLPPVVWEKNFILQYLPSDMASVVLNHALCDGLADIVMDQGRLPIARFRDMRTGTYVEEPLGSETITPQMLNWMANRLPKFNSQNRAVIPGSFHRVSAIYNRNNLLGITIRCGRHAPGCMAPVEDVLGNSVLFVGPPGVGKTTVLREAAARLSVPPFSLRVVIVDKSDEIAGEGNVPHPCVKSARRISVGGDYQNKKMIEEKTILRDGSYAKIANRRGPITARNCFG